MPDPAAQQKSESEADPRKRPRVLICEDSVLIQEALRAVLEHECDVVGLVEDGRSAIEIVAAEKPDILLVDVSVPGANGFAITEKAHQCDPDLKIVFVTARGEPEYVKRAFEVGANGYVMKGSIRTELLPAIRTVIKGERFRSALLR
ncbi:MAG TPA: response regulator transcription factor [Bryobacteraceae bacterium]|jgi:DNA-binding NarL/FixJ family response regulator|nr:response regulator transcription factor [Bryobacteraceae bacterium]